jgi:oligopeptide transport system ATP-binding protein
MSQTSSSVEVLDTGTRWQPQDGLLLEVEDLRVEFRTRYGVAKAINGVSFDLRQGETLAILGESGSGKSVTAQAIMGILDSPPGFITGGEIRYCGSNTLALPEEQRRQIRGPEISMVFQDALSSLNPVFPVGWQIAEMFRKHLGMNRRDSLERAIGLMERVQIPAARQRVKAFPHQFSGGMRQRIMIAMSIALDPAVLIADEPTTALDVTVQAQIMRLLAELQEERQMGLILITHDLGVVADVADRIAVMYAGRVVEQADVHDLYRNPAHPYTKGLLDSIPRLDQKGETLDAIGGLPPNLTNIPPGCPFNPRCHYAQDICRIDPPPPLREIARHRLSACHFSELLLAHSPELAVTRTAEEVEAYLEFGPEFSVTAGELDHKQDVERGGELQ